VAGFREKTPVIILKKNVTGLNDKSLRRFLKRAAVAAGVRGQINVLVTGNRELQSLNRRFLAKDRPTDVLSFPADSNPVNGLAGDIAISADMAAANGNRLGHSAAQEVKVLLLHGVLHLAGYDHERDHGAMGRKEARLRRALRLPVGLLERDVVSTGVRAQKPKRAAGSGL